VQRLAAHRTRGLNGARVKLQSGFLSAVGDHALLNLDKGDNKDLIDSDASPTHSLRRLVLWLFANPLLSLDDLVELRLVP
jgi:hypothetical protein